MVIQHKRGYDPNTPYTAILSLLPIELEA